MHQLQAHQQVDLGNRVVIDDGDDIEAVLRRRDPGSDGARSGARGQAKELDRRTDGEAPKGFRSA